MGLASPAARRAGRACGLDNELSAHANASHGPRLPLITPHIARASMAHLVVMQPGPRAPPCCAADARLSPCQRALRGASFQLAVARARRPLLLCLGLREHSLAAVRGLVEAVLAHPVW